ncbi:peptidoglycan DD-metalloendopeptidase family protein, partial [Streptomyces bohaiensis]
TYPVPAPATITARFAQDGPNWSSRHTGTDWAAPAGTPVMAATPGVVLAVRSAVDGHPFGTFVTVLHHDSVVTVYAHLRDAHVTRGQSVDSGQQLGTVGSTGNSTGPHLHFEVRPQIGGRHLPVDPEPYLAGAAIPAAGPQMVPVADCLPLDTAANAALPDLAHQMHPTLARLTADCPGLPAAWLTAQVMAESSWQPTAWTTDSNGGAAGLLQMSRQVWEAIEGSTGSWPPGARPPADHPVWEPATHLRVGAAHVCRNLQQMAAHLAQNPQKRISPLEASAVCHVAGCGRVTNSAAGIPVPGEADCGAGCVTTIHAYIDNIHRHLTTPPG